MTSSEIDYPVWYGVLQERTINMEKNIDKIEKNMWVLTQEMKEWFKEIKDQNDNHAKNFATKEQHRQNAKSIRNIRNVLIWVWLTIISIIGYLSTVVIELYLSR